MVLMSLIPGGSRVAAGEILIELDPQDQLRRAFDQRADLNDIVARHGPGYSLVDKLERCRMVECISSTFYLASRTYGGQWTTLLRDPELVAAFEELPPVRTARG